MISVLTVTDADGDSMSFEVEHGNFAVTIEGMTVYLDAAAAERAIKYLTETPLDDE